MSCPSETRLQAFVDGELSRDEIDALSAHLDTCDDCRTLVAVVQPVLLDDDSAADRVGRYVLRRVLGRGGMGVVYEAVDPELHRIVALKVLRSDLATQQKRLQGEAQAMAKLSHPNVVTIHDVGRDGDRVFIVMTLVQGVSLRHWLAREPRSLPAILDAFEQAADGLAAAHDAGLVHRDFKPENVFVADDGRVQVGDFGLAVSGGDAANEGEGSLAYMAPEQRSGGEVDARSDQYSFCLALGEGLQSSPAVPRWLGRLVARGTTSDPAARFASMRALLAALRRGRARSHGRRFALAGVTFAAVLGAGGILWARARDAPDVGLCRARQAEMAAIWNDDVAKEIERAFEATRSPLAEGAWRRTSAVLAEYTPAWQSAHRSTCETPRPRDAASIAARAQQTSCLDERLEMVRAVTASLRKADAPMLEQVPSMLQLLPRVSACQDARAIAQLAPPPSAGKAAAVEATKKKIAAASATVAAGRYEQGLALADDAWQSANGAGYLPVLAEAYLWVGIAHGRLGHARESEQALEQAASSASAGRAPELAVRAWIQLMHFVGFEGKRYEDGVRYAEYAKAALETMPEAFELEAERLSWSRAMLLDQRRYDDALVVSRQELALVELRFGASHRLSAVAADGLAGVLAGQCKARDALEPQEKACAILEKELGTPHPQLALCVGNLAALHGALGEHEAAIALKSRALGMFEHVPGHPNHVAMAHRNMVRSLLALGRLDEAEKELETARPLSLRESDETNIILMRSELRRRQGKPAEALTDSALAVTRTRSAEPARRLDPLLAEAESELGSSLWVDAASHAAEAGSIALRLYGERSCRIAEPLRAHADALLGAGHASDALPLAERALAALRDAQLDSLARARAELAVARALPPADRERARALATSAREAFARDGHEPKLLAAVDTWLAAAP
jgi:tetratricopeptide (TPR) repeat protein/predicted Ser/Thr protein kinase